MTRQRDTSMPIRVTSITILALLIALAAAAYYSGLRVQRDGDLIAQDAVPGTIHAHHMRMAISRSIGWALAAASAQTAQSRDACLKVVHEADEDFAKELKQYETTIKINSVADRALIQRVSETYAEFLQKRMAYEALIQAGDRDGAAAFLERDLLPVFTLTIQAAEDVIRYNHENSLAFSDSIQRSVNQLYWAVAVVVMLALACAVVLVLNLTVRRRELKELEEKEEKFSKAFQANPTGIAITEVATGRYLEVNDSFCRILGYSQPEVIGFTTLDKGIWASEEQRQRLLQPLLDGGALRNQELQVRTRYGVRKTVSLNAELIELAGTRCLMTLIEDITERKQAMEQNELLKVSIDHHFDAAYWMDTNNHLVYVNDAACKSVGYSREELLGQSVSLLAPHATPQALQEVWQQLREAGFLTRQSMHRRKDGSEFPVEIVASYVRFEGREFNCGFARDITERRRLEQKQAELAAIVESSEDAIIGKSLEGVITSWNRGAEHVFGYTAAEAVGQPLRMLFPTEREKEEADILVKIARGETVRHFETVRVRKDGRKIIISATISPLKDASGRVVGASKIARDITAQKHAEEALREKQAQLLRAMDIAKLAHWEFDVRKKRVSADEHIFQLLGTTAAEEGGLSMSPEEYIRRFVHPQDAGIVAGEVALGIATTDPHFARQFEHRVIRRDGAVRVMLVRARILMDGSGRPGRILGTNQDITEQKQAELRIRQLNRIYAVLSAINKTIVHEKDPQVMLTKTCQIAVETGGFRMAWVGMGEASTQTVRPVASAGVVEGYLDLLNIDLRDEEQTMGPSGRCFLSGEHAACGDLEHAPFPEALRGEALRRGYRSSACFPLKVEGKVTGIFSLYSGEAGFFDAEEMRLLDEMALDIGFALEVSAGEARRRQAEQELRWRTAFFEAQVHSAVDGILVVDSEGRKLLQNRRMNELWKIPAPIADDPDDSKQVQFVLGRVRQPEDFAKKLAHLNAHPDESSSDVIEMVDGTIMERYSAPVRGSDGTY